MILQLSTKELQYIVSEYFYDANLMPNYEIDTVAIVKENGDYPYARLALKEISPEEKK